MKFEVEKFNGKMNFELWKIKMKDMAMQQGLQKSFLGKSKRLADMSNEEYEDMYLKSLNTIQLCLTDDDLFNIIEEDLETCLWVKLEIMYMTKSLINIIFLERNLYTLRIINGSKIHDHLNTFNDPVFQLTSMDGKIDD